MKYIITPFLALFLLTGIAGCGQQTINHGHQLNERVVDRLQENTSTKQDVLRALGSPAGFGALDPNVWIYPSLKTTKKPVEAAELEQVRTLVLTFNDAGVLTQKEIVRQTDPVMAQPVDKKTPTHGQSLGIIDQMLGNVGGGSF
mgnify:CR=1 FL=1